tara:strand:- start:9182 stop:9634 length:453 start_codon:yes stop_codon:yes gene_type:complete
MEIHLEEKQSIRTNGLSYIYEKTKSNLSYANLINVVGIVILMTIAIIIGLIHKTVESELNYIHRIFEENNETLSYIQEIAPTTKHTMRDIEEIEIKQEKILQVIEFTLEVLVRFCRSPTLTDYCLMAVPDSYNYTQEMISYYEENPKIHG